MSSIKRLHDALIMPHPMFNETALKELEECLKISEPNSAEEQ